MREVADVSARDSDVELASGRRRQPGAEPEQRRLPGPVRPRDEQEVAAADVQLDAPQDAPVAVALLQPVCPDHGATLVARVRPSHVRRRRVPAGRGAGLSQAVASGDLAKPTFADMEFVPRV